MTFELHKCHFQFSFRSKLGNSLCLKKSVLTQSKHSHFFRETFLTVFSVQFDVFASFLARKTETNLKAFSAT